MRNHDQTEERLTVIGICGSIRPGSYTRMAMRIALQSAAEAGAQIQLLDLEKFQRGFGDGQSAETSFTTDVLRLRQEVRQAQAIILGTPEYHGSFSGILKTTLDLLEGSELKGKIIGLISVAGGALGGLDALNGLRVICRSLQAWAIPQQVAIPEAWKLFDENGVLQNPALEKRLQELGRQVVRYAHLHTMD
jgi:FMN reductase